MAKKDSELFKKIGKKLRQKRIDLELNMGKMSEKSGIPGSTLSRWERGNVSYPKRGMIEKLAKAYKIPIEELRVAEPGSTSRTSPNILEETMGSGETPDRENDVWREIAKLHKEIAELHKNNGKLEARVAELEKEKIREGKQKAV